MTWSIVARDPETGALAVAVTTCAFAVGARVPYGLGLVGAIATQSYVSPFYGIDGLRYLQEGRSAQEAIDIVRAADPASAQRQVHAIDRWGRTAVFTGEDCVDWAGCQAAENVSVAGNMLAGPQVVERTLETWLQTPELDFDDRLLTALEAGQAAGGDKRGKQSAALKLWTTEVYPAIDIRVDDHPEPLVELRRLWRVAHQRYVPFQAAGPTRLRPAGIQDRALLDEATSAYARDWNARHPETPSAPEPVG
ncbi:DUF1028 domain-containing protein [Alsobacter sp. SYSU M60028]|uniref:DUF1028 domain-containing protein n=1 Tax=Alsobacter ponti TaxID=2962936 RepID=A0ABT1L8A1_9HYPH|nr:DUF1028 domain-containing protein [Alsobacter ponti]MCP8936950.1 DUF1028 domain-containing protein [Alsobacter ponti]